MKKRKISIILIFAFIFIIAGFTKVMAASVSLEVPTSVTVGDTITAKITGKSEQWNLTLLADGSKIAESNNLTNEGSEISISKNGTYNTQKAGTVTFTLKGDYSYTSGNKVETKEVNITKTVTVNEKKEEPKNNDNNTNTSTSTTNKASSDATLQMLGINPNDFRGFEGNKTSYSVTVPKETSKINIYATKKNGQTVTGTGDKNLSIGENKFNVTVTAADKKTIKTYTIVVTRESVSKNATLTNLGIRPNDFTGFKPGTLSYTATVPYGTEKIEVYANKRDGQTVTGIGEKTLDVGKNTFKVQVTAEDKKTTNTYTIVVNRKEEGATTSEEPKEEEPKEETPTNSNVKGLTKLEVAGVTLNPKFDNGVYEYTIDVTDETKKLDLKTETSSDKYKVEVVGNENLKLGENVVTILVTNGEDKSITTYQIITNVKQAPVDVSLVNSTMNNAQKSLKIQRIMVYVVAAIILILIVVFFIKRNKLLNEEDYDEEDDNKYSEVIDTEENEEEPEAKRHHAKGRRYK